MRYLILAFVLIFGMASPAFAQDHCGDILRNGSFDVTSTQSDSQAVSTFLNWYRSFDAGKSSDQKHADLILISDPSIDLGLDRDQQQSFLHALDTLNSGFSQYDAHTSSYAKIASKVIADAWKACMTQPGVWASLKFTDNPVDIFLYIVFRPFDGNGTAIVRFSPPANLRCEGPRHIAVTNAGTTVRCTRKTGTAGAIALKSDTAINSGANVLGFASTYLHIPKSGQRYATCRIIDRMLTDTFNLGPPQAGPRDYHEIGGGTPTWTLRAAAPDGYVLTNIQLVCTKLSGDRPCEFVRGFTPANLVWIVPDRQVQISPTTDSDRVGLQLTAAIQRRTPVTQDQVRPQTIVLKYGMPFEITIPANAEDALLACGSDGDADSVSITSLPASGGQINLIGSHLDDSGERIVQASVMPFDIDQ